MRRLVVVAAALLVACSSEPDVVDPVRDAGTRDAGIVVRDAGQTARDGGAVARDGGETPRDGGTARDGGTNRDGGPRDPDGIVVDVAWLMARIDDPTVQIIDTRASGFDAEHIRGAVPLTPLDLIATVDGVRAQRPDPMDAETTLSAMGIDSSKTAVVYGENPEFDPARITWLLSNYGHADVRYLDGGWSAWRMAGGAIESDAVVTSTTYVIADDTDPLRVTGDWVLAQLGPAPYDNAAIQILDVRSPGEFQSGRIPTAVHVDWNENLDPDGFLKPDAELDALYAGFDKTQTTVVYCLVGWRASVGWLVLTHLGFEDVRVYDGSWTEWGGGGFPVEN